MTYRIESATKEEWVARCKVAEDRVAGLEEALITTRALVCEGATVGFNFADGDWADRLYQNNGNISNTLRGTKT